MSEVKEASVEVCPCSYGIAGYFRGQSGIFILVKISKSASSSTGNKNMSW